MTGSGTAVWATAREDLTPLFSFQWLDLKEAAYPILSTAQEAQKRQV